MLPVPNIIMKNFIVNIHLTNICNYQCVYCSEDLPYMAYKSYYIPIELLKYIDIMIKKYLYTFDNHIFLYGGELLLYPHLLDTIKLFNNNIYISDIHIVSNNSIDMKQIFNIDIKYTTNIHFTFSVHLFEMEKHNFNKQWKIFVDNITFIKENIPTSTINVSILKDFRYSIDYLEKVKKELEKYNIYVEIARIHSTQNFITPDKSKNINNHYLKTRYTNRHISISKSFIDDKYYISNQCAMSYYIKPLYDIKVWKSLVENYNNKSECNQNLCLCSYCNQIGYEQD